MTRVGILLVIAFLTYAWCRWGLATRGFSPLIQLGKTSLVVYWVHIEFVYGRFSILPKRVQTILRRLAWITGDFPLYADPFPGPHKNRLEED